MRIAKEDIEAKYRLFNKEYFGGKLPKIHFSTYNSKSSWGLIIYNPSNKWKSKISLARNVDWTEADFDSTIIHEMVHLYLHIYDPRYRGKNPLYNRPHGKLFKQEARRFKEQYGIDIISKPRSKFIPPKNKKRHSNRFVQAIVDWVDRYIL